MNPRSGADYEDFLVITECKIKLFLKKVKNTANVKFTIKIGEIYISKEKSMFSNTLSKDQIHENNQYQLIQFVAYAANILR